jgi:glycosyltransferase involved in cell wall biosynthesis
MKIGIDVQTTKGQPTGFGFYVNNLVNALKNVADDDKLVTYSPSEEHDLSTPQRFWWDQVTLPSMAYHSKLDIFHQPAFSVPVFYKGLNVVTIHDVISMLRGDIPFFSRQYYAKWMPFSYKYADHVITISEHSKKDIIEHLNIAPEQITVIYEAVDDTYKNKVSIGQIDSVLKKYKITGPYILNVGTINPRKNLEFLVRVFAEVKHRNKSNHKLVLTGKKGWHYDQLFELVKDLKLSDEVIFTGYVDEPDKPALYHGATLFAFPSLYEGFGLPPLEAMTCGVPTISSNVSSLPEVIGNGGISLSPNDEEAWVKSIILLLNSGIEREKLIKLGHIQAAKFSWEKCAKETLDVYHKVLDEKLKSR